MRRIQGALSCIFLVLLVSGCSRTRLGSHTYKGLPPKLAQEFQYPRSPKLAVETSVVEEKGNYILRRVSFPIYSIETNKHLVMDYYDLKTSKKTPVIIILPILGGSYDVEKIFANYFTKQGYAVVLVHREKKSKELEKVEFLNAMLKQTVIDNKQAIDWIETQPDLDADRIGVFGASMGAIKGAMLTPLEPRIKAAVLGLGGGNLPYILTHSTEKGIIKRRNNIMRDQNLTMEQLEVKLKEGITCDPLVFASYADPSRILMILAKNDTVVPIETGRELRKQMGEPETIMIPGGHYTAVVYLPYIQSASHKFFQRKFYPKKGESMAKKIIEPTESELKAETIEAKKELAVGEPAAGK